MKISKELYKFFKEWLEWAEDGGDGLLFDRSHGLCDNTPNRKLYHELRALLCEMFEDSFSPFNEDVMWYKNECDSDACHLNTRRLAFVREQIKKYGEA